MTQYKPADLVYFISSQISLIIMSSRKFRVIYIAPLVVYKILDKFQYIPMDIEGKYWMVFSILTDLSKHL